MITDFHDGPTLIQSMPKTDLDPIDLNLLPIPPF